MSKLNHRALSKFLSKPRFAHEVAEHYGISKKLADFHLREAITSGQVLISEKPVLQTLRNSHGKLKRFRRFLYVSQNSPMLADGWTRFKMKEAKGLISPATGDVFSIRFLSQTHGLIGKGIGNQKFSGFVFKEATCAPGVERHFKTDKPLTSEFDVASTKMKLTHRRTIEQLLEHATPTISEETASLPYAERIRLFQALLKEPLPFLDLHGRFGGSKQIIRGLVRNGLLMEVWGPRAIGVVFKLTNKGKMHLKELEAAAKHEPNMRNKTYIRLKQRTM